ncbi:hypothetical protein [Nonlabens tegetincola]|uniref:hypothetical protein n=1 Tax=Nonlabens tegetincola TaxID=323273 RepID=UPI000CF4B793|nr:hypothetical protein [Nonlabens tegetincola]PQJ17023.1 hypothetical protein BST93_10140 [Nonlabens tegetincola]
MEFINSEKYTATVTIGLQKGYTKDLWPKSEVIVNLQEDQNQLIQDKSIYLSAAVSECEIVLSGQVDSSLKIEFINYPKFPLDEKVFKESVSFLSKRLMKELNQNRIVIVFHNEIVMLEDNPEIDPRILVK